MNSQIEKYFNLVDKPFDITNIDENYIIILSSCVPGSFKELSIDNDNILQQFNKLNPDTIQPFQVKDEKESFQLETYKIHDLIGSEKKLVILFTNIYCTSHSFGDDTIYERTLRFRQLFGKLFNENKKITNIAMSFDFINVESYHKQMYFVFMKDEILKRKIDSKLLKISLYNSHEYLQLHTIQPNVHITQSIKYTPNILNSKSVQSNHVYLFNPYDVHTTNQVDGVNGMNIVISSVNPTWTRKLDELEIPYSWRSVFANPTIERQFIQLTQFVSTDFDKFGNDIPFLPEQNNIFKAFELCSYDNIKAVIIGQDPYPNTTHAMGLAFSVKRDVSPIPGSLKNIYRALTNDTNIPFVTPTHGDLTTWTKQGILMINTALTLRINQGSNAHLSKWQGFTDELLKLISKKKRNIVFILWGGSAQKKTELIDNSRHLILKYIHPSPRNGSQFHNCPNFSQTNQYLTEHNITPIDWSVV